MAEELVKQKVELLAQQKTKSDRIYELLNGPGGFNENSRKALKNLEAAITASKRPGYFTYHEAPDHIKAAVRSGEVERLHTQVMQLQKQIDQLTEKIDGIVHSNEQSIVPSPVKQVGGDDSLGSLTSPSVHNMKQWFSTYGEPKQANSDMYSNFTPGKKVYGGTSHYSAFRSQSSTMKKGRLTK